MALEININKVTGMQFETRIVEPEPVPDVFIPMQKLLRPEPKKPQRPRASRKELQSFIKAI